MDELLLQILATIFNKKPDELTTILFEGDGDSKKLKSNAKDLILDWHKEKVKTIKDEGLEKFNNGYKKAEKEFKTIAEDSFKTITGFTPDGDMPLEDMVKTWVENQTKVNTKTITDDIIKKHPIYLSLEKSSIPKTDHEKVVQDFESYKKNQVRAGILSNIKDKAWSIIEKKKPTMGENPAVASTRKEVFLKQLESYDYQIEKDDIIILGDEGKRLEDSHGNRIAFDKLVNDIATKHFDFETNGGGTGNSNDKDKPVVITEKPKTKAEYNIAMDKYQSNSEEDMKKRVALTSFYKANKLD